MFPSSPVMVRVLRSVTPGTLRTWGRQSTKDNNNPKNRVFQLIKSGYEEVSNVELLQLFCYIIKVFQFYRP